MANICGKRIREQRKLQCVTVNRLAELSGVGRTTLVNYENRNTWPSSYNLVEICKALNVSSDYILGLSEQP